MSLSSPSAWGPGCWQGPEEGAGVRGRSPQGSPPALRVVGAAVRGQEQLLVPCLACQFSQSRGLAREVTLTLRSAELGSGRRAAEDSPAGRAAPRALGAPAQAPVPAEGSPGPSSSGCQFLHPRDGWTVTCSSVLRTDEEQRGRRGLPVGSLGAESSPGATFCRWSGPSSLALCTCFFVSATKCPKPGALKQQTVLEACAVAWPSSPERLSVCLVPLVLSGHPPLGQGRPDDLILV